MTRRARIGLLAAAGLLAPFVLLFRGELGILLANQRPDDEAARLIEQLGVSNGDSLAEIGAGAGRLTVAMGKALPGSRVYSTELSQDRLRDTRQAVERASLRNVDVREAAVAGTNLPDACCDAIFMRTVYHHFTSPPDDDRGAAAQPEAGRPARDYRVRAGGIWTWFAVPHDTPDRGGHGVPREMLLREVTAGGRFRHVRTVDDWAGRLYLMVFQRDRG